MSPEPQAEPQADILSDVPQADALSEVPHAEALSEVPQAEAVPPLVQEAIFDNAMAISPFIVSDYIIECSSVRNKYALFYYIGTFL